MTYRQRQQCCVPMHAELITAIHQILLWNITAHIPSAGFGSTMVEIADLLSDLVLVDEINESDVREILQQGFTWEITYVLVDFVTNECRRIRGEWDSALADRAAQLQRWRLARCALATAYINSRCNAHLCTGIECCGELREAQSACGFGGPPGLVLDGNLPNSDERLDTTLMLEEFRHSSWWLHNNPFEGMLEVPRLVGVLLYEDGWDARIRDAADLPEALRHIVIREFFEEMINRSFTNEFFELHDRKVRNNESEG